VRLYDKWTLTPFIFPGILRARRQRELLILATPVIASELATSPARQFAFDVAEKLVSYDLFPRASAVH
jgi:hypothetical protein